MLIGQLSKLTGFSKDTIRFYEKIGLIVLPRQRRGASGYKDYPDELVALLRAIRKYKELGFTLEEIRELLVMQEVQVLDVARLLHIIDLKITGINAEIDKLHEARLRLGREQRLLLQKKTGHIITLPEMRVAA